MADLPKLCLTMSPARAVKRVLIVVGSSYRHSFIIKVARLTPLAPVIGSVTAEALSLSDIQVTATLSDDGGQLVEEYTVSHTGCDRYIILLTLLFEYTHACG